MLITLKKNQGLRLAILAAVVFFILTLMIGLHRHLTFYSSYDQGIFNQVFWNGIHGRFFQSSLSSQLSTNVVHNNELPEVFYHRLGQHFTPALLLWLPIYALFPNPATLTVIQVTLITAAGLVLYALARHYLEPSLAVMITISFYSAIAIVGPTVTNFHDICQTPLYVFTILLAMEKRWWWLFIIMSIILLAVREDSGITLFGIGFYMIASRRFPRIGLSVCIASFGYIVILTNLIMPLFSADISRRFMLERFGQYATGDEASTLEILWGMISNPLRLIFELFTPFFDTIEYLLGHWLPLAFIPAIAPASWLISGFPLLKLFLGKGESVLAITIRYAMTIVPGLFYGAILWWAGQGFKNFTTKLEKLKPRQLNKGFRRFWIFCLAISLCFALGDTKNRSLYFVIPDSIEPFVYVSLPQQWQRVGEIRSIIAKIPDSASVSATTYIIPHLSGRREIIRLPELKLKNDQGNIENVDYAVADLWRLQHYQVAFRHDLSRLKILVSLIDEISNDSSYGIVDFKNGVILLQKAADNNPEAIVAWLAFRQEIEGILSQTSQDNLSLANK